jgi:hypothetical protein
MKNNFKGGMSSDLTAFDVAKKWKISPIEFMPILEKGTEHEMEHTDDKDIARRIALDHIVERLDYYDLLDKIEKMKIGGVVKKSIQIAPNGRPSHLTQEQWHLVRTPDFKGWFGFWDLYAYDKANEYYEPSVRKIAKELKENKLSAIEEVANFLSRQVTEDDVLIPMPSRTGISTDTKKLAEKISEKTGAKIFDCLVGRKRESIYQLKKRNEDVSDFDFEFQINCEIPKAKNYFIVDNVIATGVTMKNALKNVMDKVGDNVSPLVYAIDLNYISKVVDENGEPLVVWHYSRTLKNQVDKFYIFNVDKELGSHFGTLKQSQSLKYNSKGERELEIVNEELIDFRYYQVFLNIKNPIRLKDEGVFKLDTLTNAIGWENLEDNDWLYINNYNNKTNDTHIDRAKYIAKSKFGYDGAVYLNRYESDAKISFIMSLDEVSDKIFKMKVQSADDSWIAFEPNQIKLADGTNTTFDGKNPDIRFGKGGLIAPNGNESNLTPKQYKLVRTEAFKDWFGDWENDPENASKIIDKNGEPKIVYHGTNNDFTIFDKNKLGEKNFFAESASLGFFFAGNIKTSEAYIGMNSMDWAGVQFGAYDDIINKYKPELDSINKDIQQIYEKYRKQEKDNIKKLQEEIIEKIRETYKDFSENDSKGIFLRDINWDEINRLAQEENNLNGNTQKLKELNDKIKSEIEAKWKVKTNANPRIISLFLNIRNPYIIDYANNKQTDLSQDIKKAIKNTNDGVIFNNLNDGDDVDDIFVVFDSEQIKLADGTNTSFDRKDPDIRFGKGGDTNRNFNDKELLKRYNDGESIGFTAIAHLKAQGLIKRSDGTTRKSEKYMEDGGINLSNKELMAHDFFNEQKELQRNSKYAILLDASYSNYTNETREVFNNLKDELIDKLGFNPLINYSPFGSGVLSNRGNVILMFDDDSNLLGLLEFTIEPKYTIVPRYSPDYIKPEPIFENNENVFYIEYIFSFSRGNGQKMMNRIKKYADQYNVDIGLEGSIVEGTEGKPIASAKHLQRFYDKQGFINVRGHYFLYTPNSMAEGGELSTENKIYEITRHYFGSLRASSMGGYFNIEGVSLRIKNHLANWNNFYEYHLKNIDENVNPYFLSIVINSGNSYKDQDEADINTEEFVNDHIEENTNLKAEEIVFDSSDSIKDIIYIIDKKMKKMTSMAKGGKTISQTPAPASDRVSGSKTNPKGSASDTSLAKSIKFNDSLLKAIENKVKAHNEEYPSKKVTTPTAKAVVRRGMGAYSKSHRPFITGGAPNSRQAWGLARLNKFLLKKRGVKVKSAYIQDDDLL